MKVLKKAISLIMVGTLIFGVQGIEAVAITKDDEVTRNKTGQPFSSYWYPEELLKWKPNTDEDAKFNRGIVPLQKRTKGKKINNTQSDEAKVVSLAIANEHTSSTPSQGTRKFENYNFTYWQYIDTLVAWAGSSSEGIIVPPSSDLIDSAHKNGVKILGTVFFPPEAYGGKIEWVKSFLTKDSKGNFLIGDKLLEVAKFYGFDGWFINQETKGLDENEATTFKEFLIYMQNRKDKDMDIMWYDSMINDGKIKWQRELNNKNVQYFQDGTTKVSNAMFLDFNWHYTVTFNSDGSYTPQEPTKLNNTRELAKNIGRNPYDIYAGIDVQANGYETIDKLNEDFKELYPNKTGGALNLLFPEGKEPTTSLGLYCPSWTYYSSSSYDEFLKKENRFWVSESGDPRNNETNHSWKGISRYFVEKSPITTMPFITNFNMGNGNFYNVNGQRVGTASWNNRSLQEVMPTYRWILNNDKNNLKASEDYNEAYYGGSSIKFEGSIKNKGTTLVNLFSSDLSIRKDSVASVIYKDNSNVNLKLALTLKGTKNVEYLDLKSSGDIWKTGEINLNKLSGKQIENIAIVIEGNEDKSDFKLNLGRIEFRNSLDKFKIGKPSNLKIDSSKIREDYYATARLSWNKVDGEVDHYEIYRVKENGEREFIGATPNNVYYVQEIERDGREKNYEFVVRAINKYFQSSKDNESSVSTQWPAFPSPKASFSISSKIAAPGEEIILTSTCSKSTEQLQWLIEGANIDKSTEKVVKVKFDKEGSYSITLKAKNVAGEDILRKENIIIISNEGKGGIKNISLNKSTEASGATNDGEASSKAVDGTIKNKWCSTNKGDKWLIVDLGRRSTISDFTIKHALAGGEGGSLNTSDFKIQVSDDKVNWNTVIDVKDNTEGTTNHQIEYKVARYVRLYITQAEKNSGDGGAARIYEFEVYGVDSDKIFP